MISSKFDTKLTLLPPVTKMAKLPRLQLYTQYRKSTCPLTPTCVTSFMNAPPQSGGGGGIESGHSIYLLDLITQFELLSLNHST